MARATKKTIETIARAQRVLSKAQDAVFEAVEGSTTRFRECLERATQAERDAYSAASANLARLEQEAVDKGQAWRGTTGQLYFNSN